MAIDTYAPCPGGTGKKIKFCCADLVGDLEQLDTLVEGDQLSAALDQVKRLDEKHPGRPCLLATRVKLELAGKRFAEAEATSRRFLEACPANPVALGQAAVTEALSGRVQEAAALFDKAREAAAATGGAEASARDALEHLVRIAATLVQAAAQTGHTGFAQGLVDWLIDSSLAGSDDLRMLAAIVGSSGVPPALRTRVPLDELAETPPWRPDFDAALDHARSWRLAKALAALRGLAAVAGESRQVFTNIAVLCEMLARPVEASEAWLAVSRIRGLDHDDAVEAAGRAIALETEANPDRSPQVRFTSVAAPLAVPAGEEGVTAIGLLEDRLRHDGHCQPAAFDRAAWVSRNAAPPRSAWRIHESATGDAPPRLLATLLVFGRQTDHEPELVLQGFAPDVAAARPIVEALSGCAFAPAADVAGMPATSPTAWLLGGQYQLPTPAQPPAPPPAGAPAFVDDVVARQRRALWTRFTAAWPDTELPELLGRTPRQAVKDADGLRRVEALVQEGEATSRRRDGAEAWNAIRGVLGLPGPAAVASLKPLDEVPPLRWHRLDMDRIDIEQLRGVLVTAVDAGFERAAEMAAEALVARADATPADRWEALGILADRVETTVRRLEIIGQLRSIAKELKAGTGTLDVAELRIRLQRGDQAEIVRLLDRIKRDHGRDPQVLQALAEVLMEAGVDLGALAGRPGGMPPAGAAAAAMPGAATSPEPGKLWTPGSGEPPGPGGEKKVLWTPG